MPLLGPMAGPFLSNFKGAVPAAPALASGFRFESGCLVAFFTTDRRDRALAVTVRVLSESRSRQPAGPSALWRP